MPQDTELKTLLEEHCTTAATFEEALSTLLAAAHGNDIGVAGAWETRRHTTAPEWDVVITLLAREHAAESAASDDGTGSAPDEEDPTA